MINFTNQTTPVNTGANDELSDRLRIAIKQSQEGQLESFAVIYDAYIKKIYDYLYYRTHHKSTAEDLTSLTFTKALQNIGSFDERQGTIQAWLYRIARNSMIDYFRTRKVTSDISDAWDLKNNSNIEAEFDVNSKLDEVQDYMSKISPEHRELLVMRIWDQLSYAEIAEVTGKSEAALKMSVSRILSKLRSEVIAVVVSILLIN